jgi:hypothetical protein
VKKVILLFFLIASCAKNSSTLETTTTTTVGSDPNSLSCKNAPAGGAVNLTSPPASALNVIPITLNGSTYINAPMVSITLCTPGTATCVTVNNILLDTGSYGLRIFASTLTGITPTQINSPSAHPLAECAQFGIGSTWGPIKMADVVLGGEPAVTIPIQIIDSTFASRPTACLHSDTDPASAGYNGILGIGLFRQDCGSTCVSPNPAPDLYYSCIGSTCTASNAPLASQVTNPIYALPIDNNGSSLELPAIADCGVETVTGALILGIGTRSNNTATATTKFQTNSIGEFTTSFNGTSYTQSFIDSGSNGLFFPRIASLPSCTQPLGGSDLTMFDCPYDTVNLTATQISGATQKIITFKVNNAYNMLASPNYNFRDIAANMSSMFDWGLPFFYGRKIYTGIQGQTSSIGTGPYWAY